MSGPVIAHGDAHEDASRTDRGLLDTKLARLSTGSFSDLRIHALGEQRQGIKLLLKEPTQALRENLETRRTDLKKFDMTVYRVW